MRTVLIIVHDFPPAGGGGVMRVAKFTKYLPQYGWRPLVLTLTGDYAPASRRDETLLSELPTEAEIIRTRSLRTRASSCGAAQYGVSFQEKVIFGGVRRLICRAFHHFGVYQDRGLLWWPFALRQLWRLRTRGDIDVILTSSPPHNVHFLGIAAKRVLHKPWAADFRDGWTDDLLFRSRSRLRNTLERQCERTVIRTADHVIATTEQIDRWFADRHGAEYRQKSVVITNGYDPDDFALPPTRPNSQPPLRLVHVGSLGGRRSAASLLRAIAQVNNSGSTSSGYYPLTMEFVGSIHNADAKLASNTRGVTLLSHLPHKLAVQKMIEADVLVLVSSPESPDALTGKVFEYIAAGRPILTLAQPGLLSEFTSHHQLGPVVPPDDVAQICEALVHLADQKKNGKLRTMHADDATKGKFSRHQLTSQLASILDSLTRSQK